MTAQAPIQDFRVVLDRPGRSALDVTSAVSGLHFTTVAPGGYGSCSLSLAGVRPSEITPLSTLRLSIAGKTIWEGQVEDSGTQIGSGTATVSVSAFGRARELDENSVRKIWTRRQWDWTPIVIAAGTDLGGTTLGKRADFYQVNAGQFDPTNTALNGVEVRGAQNSGTAADGDYHGAQVIAPDGLTLTRFMCDFDINGSNHQGVIQSSADGITWTTHSCPTADGTVDVALVSGATLVRIGLAASAAQALTQTIYGRFTNIRILGSSLTEDAAGGYWIPTLLRDILALVPRLQPGRIDVDTSYVVEQLERSSRSSLRNVVDEITRYSTREWAVWDDGLFDWLTVDYDAPGWITTVAECQNVDLTASVDGMARTVYLTYQDPKTGAIRELTSISTDPRNPYVRQGRPCDLVINAGAPSTQTNAQQVADVIATFAGTFPPVRGRIVIGLEHVVRRATGSPQPAYAIRAGDNISIPDLPKTGDLMQQGRDSETLFHIVGTSVDTKAAQVTLEIENQQAKRLDVLLARLAAAA